MINSVFGNVPRGNCRGAKAMINWEAESKPLSKRSTETVFLNIPAVNVMSVAMTQSAHQQRSAKQVQQIFMDLPVS